MGEVEMARRSVTVKDVPADEFIKACLRKGTGGGALKKWYGGSDGTHRGTKKAHFQTASGAIIRKAMYELEKLEMMEKTGDGGREITSKGRAEMDRIAGNITLRVNDL